MGNLPYRNLLKNVFMEVGKIPITIQFDSVPMDLDTYFNNLIEFNNTVPYGRYIDKLDQKISKYKKILNSTENMVRLDATGQNYNALFKVYEGYYGLSWDINSAIQYIKSQDIKPIDMPVKELWEYSVDQNTIDWKYVNNSVSDTGGSYIIVVEVGFDSELRVIDGNHRIAKKWSRNPHGGKVSVYVLNNWEHILFMSGEGYRFVYRIIENCRRYMDYLLSGKEHNVYSINYREVLYKKFAYGTGLIK